MCGKYQKGRQNIKTPFFFKFYLFMRDMERETKTQAEGEADSLEGA